MFILVMEKSMTFYKDACLFTFIPDINYKNCFV